MLRTIRLLLFAASAAMLSWCASGPPADLDAWVARAMKEFEVPGVAVAIVKDGQAVYSKGFGVRKIGEPGAVDAHTLFGIASNTKAFTSTALALLVDDGKVKWDDPVTKYLPSFALYDPLASREITVRDLLCHRTGLGLGAGDLLFWPDTDVTREQVVGAARWIRPASSLRSKYAYNNLMFVVAGEVIRAASGQKYDDFIRDRIFTPLGMTESRITAVSFKPGENIAMPHSRGWRLAGTLTPITPTKDETWAAAAGVKSNLTDLAKWLGTHLNSGKFGDKQIWSERREGDLQWPQTIIGTGGGGATTSEILKKLTPNFSAYGLGFSLRDYKGRKIVSHGGALTGMLTTIYMLPQEKLGIIVLTNQEEGGAMSSIAWRIIDHYLGEPEADYITAYAASRAASMKRANDAEAKAAGERNLASKPSLPLSGYAGAMQDAWYGKATLVVDDGRLVLRMSRTPAMVAGLIHWQYDTFKAVFRDKTIPEAFVTFSLNPAGKVSEMRMEAVNSIADFSFDYSDLLFTPVETAAK